MTGKPKRKFSYFHNKGLICNTFGPRQQPANNQPYKDGKMHSLGSRPESIITFQDLRYLDTCTCASVVLDVSELLLSFFRRSSTYPVFHLETFIITHCVTWQCALHMYK